MSDKILVFGHQKPDTDAIGSSYGFSYLSNHRPNGALNTEVVALGTPNEETQFVLDYFGVKAPRVVKSAKEEGVDTVILTDHNEFQQSISDIEDLTIYGVVDHHRVANFNTAAPLFMTVEPVGSASSIVYRKFLEANVEIPKEVAGLLLSGLISDTLLLKSPTTHVTDHKVAKELAEIAGVNLEEYGLAMLKAGTNLSTKTAEELIDIDAKTFELNGSNVRIAQVNTVDIPEVLERLSDTLLLKSPTTHVTDHKVAKELAEIAGVNLEEYGLAMLKAGTNLSTKTAEELIDIDAKTFELNGSNVRIAQVNTVDIPEVLERLSDIKAAINASMTANGYDDFVFMITDIVNSNSEIIALGAHPEKSEAAFNFTLADDHAFLAGAVSRKKQVVPQLTESFNK